VDDGGAAGATAGREIPGSAHATHAVIVIQPDMRQRPRPSRWKSPHYSDRSDVGQAEPRGLARALRSECPAAASLPP